MSADSPRRPSGNGSRGMVTVPAIVPPQVVSDRSILDSAIGFINEVTLAHQPLVDAKDTITWARFEICADISDPRYGDDWELEGNVAPPLLLILGYGLGVQVWAIPANGEAVEVLSWRHGIVTALRVLPTPTLPVAIEENDRADEPTDVFVEKRPLIALVDGNTSSGVQPQFCSVNFVSLKTGTQVKTIKFKNPVIDILANRSSIVITFHERIAVFDARTLEDRLSITTCYPSPGINPNPVALGQRWLAYAENKLLNSKRSGGGCDGDGVTSYTATVLNASKSLVKGLRELGEQVAAGLTGTSSSGGNSKNTSFDSGCGVDSKQSGIVTIIDIKNPVRDYSPTSGVPKSNNQTTGIDSIIAHFIAHSEALVAMEFDNSGMLLVTADRRGHDFHVFRIEPNPIDPILAAVHHLYILHRGDTSAKVQNITLSLDSRWVAVSTLRGTTHVFPITPYGGTMGVRTHTSLHVVNKLSRFHRSAGLSAEGRSNSPISHSESTTFTQSLRPYHNSTLPPFPRPTVVMPLAQLRQPFALGPPPGSGTLAGVKSVAVVSGTGSQRQRLSSLSDDNGKPLSVCAVFAKSRSWLLDPPNVTREAPHRIQRKAVDSLFIMAGHGALIQYDLDTKLASNVAKEKICDDTPIELEVEAKAQWNLGRRKEGSQEIVPPLSSDNWLIKDRNSCMLNDSTRQNDDLDSRSESWLAQVEIITHAGPHRRLWMGPQFVFKTYNTPSGSNLNHVDIEAVEIGTAKTSTTTTTEKLDQSSPLNMPLTAAGRSNAVPILIESGSYSSIEQSPKLMDRFRHDHLDSDFSLSHGDSRLKEDLADAMRECPSVVSSSKDTGGHGRESAGSSDNVDFYDALAAQDDQDYVHARSVSVTALANALPNIHSYDNCSSFESLDLLKKSKASIEKIVNPLGTVTTVTSCLTSDVKTDILDEVVSQLATEGTIIHENCDESLFRPVVAIFCDEMTRLQNEEEALKNSKHCQPPETISNKLVVPVIPKEVDDELNKREKKKNNIIKLKSDIVSKDIKDKEQNKIEKRSSLNKKVIVGKQKTNEDVTKFSVLRCEEIQNQKSANIGDICEEKVLENEAEITPVQVTSHFGKVEKMTSKNSEKTNVSKIQIKGQPRRSKNELEAYGMSEVDKKNIKDNPIPKDVFVRGSKNEKIITGNISNNNIRNDDAEKQNTAEKKENVKHASKENRNTYSKFPTKISSNEEENESYMSKSTKEHKEMIVKTISVNDKKLMSQNLAKVKSTCIDKSIKKEKFKKENEMNKSIKVNKKDLQIVNEKINTKELENSLDEIKSNEKHSQCNETKEIKKNDFNIVTDMKIENNTVVSPINPVTNNNKKRTNKLESNSKNEGNNICTLKEEKQHTEKRVSIKFSNEEPEVCGSLKNACQQAQSLSNEIKNNKLMDLIIEDNIKSENTESVISKITEEVKSDSKYVNKSICDDTASFDTEVIIDENKEKISKKISLENNPMKEIQNGSKSLENSNNIPDRAESKTETEKCTDIEKTNITMMEKEDCLEEKNVSAQSKSDEDTKNDNNTAGDCEGSASKAKETKFEEVKIDSDDNIKKVEEVEEENEGQIVLNQKNKGLDKNSEKTGNKEECKEKETENINNKLQKDDMPEKKSNMKYFKEGNEANSSPLSSPKKWRKCFLKDEPKKDIRLVTLNNVGKVEELKEKCGENKANVIKKGDKSKLKSSPKDKDVTNPTNTCENKKKIIDKTQSSPAHTSAWKTLSGSEMINKKLSKSDTESKNIHLLEALSQLNNSAMSTTLDKLLPELPTPNDMEEQITINKTKITLTLDEDSILKPLEALTPLPTLEPLQVMSENKNCALKDISLINFESPLQENPVLQRKISPPLHGFTEQNLIFALCGSLHYENEHMRTSSERIDISPTFSSNRSSTALEEVSGGDYKSLTENDDPYISLEQSSQDTNTTNTNTTNEKFSSSTNSSGSEEIVVMEEKKMTKKQKRKRQQLQELQKHKEQQQHQQEMDDEELRPLIAMTESQIEQITSGLDQTLPTLMDESISDKNLATQTFIQSTTTDSEEPMPTTTSDDNVFCPSTLTVHNPHKIKTKKLEHKINLIAAIEAATSSSTSSAEESGVELGSRSLQENGESLMSLPSIMPTGTLPLPVIGTSQAIVGSLKKKSKRRKR